MEWCSELGRRKRFKSDDNPVESIFNILATFREKILVTISQPNIMMSDLDENTMLHLIFDDCFDEYQERRVEFVRVLLSNGADVNAKNRRGMTPTHLAAKKFQVEALKIFADNGADFSQRTNQDESPLHLVCQSSLKLKDKSKMLETMDFLVSRGCDIEAADREGLMPLHYATDCGNVAIIEKLIELGAKVDCQTNQVLMTPLHLAAKADRLDIMKRLMQAGADVNAETADGVTPIFMSVLMGGFVSVQYLINQGADLYRRDKIQGFTLLHMAAYANMPMISLKYDPYGPIKYANRIKNLHYLIAKEFDVNDSGTCGITCLHLAALVDDYQSVKTLIDHGANVTFRSDISDFSALHFASMQKNVCNIELLAWYGADVNARVGAQQWTALHLTLMTNAPAWELDKSSCLRKFWPKYEKDPEFRTAVQCNALKMLIKQGANVNAKDASGKSPLHLATSTGDVALARKLLESGARANVQDNQGASPLSNSLKTRNEGLFQRLVEFGADINDDDVSRRIMENEYRRFKRIAIEHAIKLKLVGLPIAKIYESSVRDSAFDDFSAMCAEEVDSLKKHSIGDLSLYEFLRLNIKRQSAFVETIQKSYLRLQYSFPIYFNIIRGTCSEAVVRKPFLESARIAWRQISKVYMPDLCIENILSHANNRYLEALVASANLN